MNEPVLLSCPFCWQDAQEVIDIEVESCDLTVYTVKCDDCGCLGPQAMSEITAMHLWNLAPRQRASMYISGESLSDVITKLNLFVESNKSKK